MATVRRMARGAIRGSFAGMMSSVPTGVPAPPVARPATWRTFSRNTLELAGITGVVLRLYRAAVLSLESFSSWPMFIGALIVAVVLLCAVLTWNLSNFPIRRWPSRVAVFLGIEVASEFGMSSVLIALRREPLGSGMATWHDWWPLAGQTLLERGLVMAAYATLLAGAMWLVTRRTRIDA
jgi:hypothetical protein